MVEALQLNKIDWHVNDPATSTIIDALLADMGVGKDDDPNSLIAVEATKRWCISEIKFHAHLGEVLPMGELNVDASNYFHGYLACLNDLQHAR